MASVFLWVSLRKSTKKGDSSKKDQLGEVPKGTADHVMSGLGLLTPHVDLAFCHREPFGIARFHMVSPTD